MNNPNIIPIKGQIRNEFPGPALADMMVPTFEALADTKYNYFHKIVWVVSERSWYYIWREIPANGIIPRSDYMNYWKRVTQNASIPEWRDGVVYFYGDCVFYTLDYEEWPKRKVKIYMWVGTEPSYSIDSYGTTFTGIRKESKVVTIDSRDGFGIGEILFINGQPYEVVSATRLNAKQFDVIVSEELPEVIELIGKNPSVSYFEPDKNPNWLCMSDDALGFRMEITTPEFIVGQEDIVTPLLQVVTENDNGTYTKTIPEIEYDIDNKCYKLAFYIDEHIMTQDEWNAEFGTGDARKHVYLMIK